MARMMQEEIKLRELDLELLDQEVITLHNIARNLEQSFGFRGQISDDIRQCADRLNEILKRF